MVLLILLSGLIPIIMGLLLNILKVNNKLNKVFNLIGCLIPLVLNILITSLGCFNSYNLLKISSELEIILKVDVLSCVFAILFSFIYSVVGIYSFKYFEEDKTKYKFDLFYLLSLGSLMLLCYSGNLISMYVSFEFVTLFSMPMVMHEKSKESVDASIKYLVYSVSGAFLGLIGIIYLSLNTSSTEFIMGGSILPTVNKNLLYVFMLITVIGFGAKAGMFPLHSWLPSAHPVAPAPASAILSGIITKSGIVALIRIIYYVVGTEILTNSWFQYVWIILILITILLGSFMALIQKNFKRRLAFSSISQISYALLGIALLTEGGLTGCLLQVFSHATIKVILFLVAGILIHILNKHDVDEIEGVGKVMPITMWCYTIASLGLIGIPFTSGFISKWYLATSSIATSLPVLNVLGPIVLIISAILTAAYLLTLVIKAFFPENKENLVRVKEPLLMVLPLIILTILVIVMGVFTSPIVGLVNYL